MAERPGTGHDDCIATLTVKRLVPEVNELKTEASDWRLQVTFESEELVRDFDNIGSLPVTDVGQLSDRIPQGCGKTSVFQVRVDVLGRGESNPFSGRSHFAKGRYRGSCPGVIRDIVLEVDFRRRTKEYNYLGEKQWDSFNSTLIDQRLSGTWNRILPDRAQLYSHLTFQIVCDIELTCLDSDLVEVSPDTNPSS